jgi:hypothetical protein
MSDAPCPRADCEGTLTVVPAEQIEGLPAEDELDVVDTYARCSMCGFMFSRAEGEEAPWLEVDLST